MKVSLERRKKRVLFASRYLAVGGWSGNDEYVVAVLKGLADLGFEIDYLWLGYPATHLNWHRLSPKTARAQRYLMPYAWRIGKWIVPRGFLLGLWIFLKRIWNYSQRFTFGRRSRLLQRMGTWLQERLNLPERFYGRGAFPQKDDFTAFGRALESSRPDLVVANYYMMAPLFDAMADRQVGKVLLTHDARHGAISHEVELELLQKADLLLAIQEDDLKELKRDLPRNEVVLLPMPVVSSLQERRPQRGRVIYVGSAHERNIEGLGWFLKEVWLRVLDREPEAMLHICGAVEQAFPESFPHVRKLGVVDDLGQEYAEAMLAVVPLLGGTGLKIKLVEALQHGCPVVSTPPGLQGLGFAENRCIARAGSAEEMVETICRLLTDEATRRCMEGHARAVVEEHFSPRASFQPFMDWFERRANGPAQIQKEPMLHPTI